MSHATLPFPEVTPAALSIPEEGWLVLCLLALLGTPLRARACTPTHADHLWDCPELQVRVPTTLPGVRTAFGPFLTVTGPSQHRPSLSLCLAISLHKESEKSSSFPGIFGTPSEPSFLFTAFTTLCQGVSRPVSSHAGLVFPDWGSSTESLRSPGPEEGPEHTGSQEPQAAPLGRDVSQHVHLRL